MLNLNYNYLFDFTLKIVIMESFKSFENKFQYRIVGHSGDSPNAEFVKEGKYPRNEKEEFKILSQMYLHSQFCLSGGKISC